MASATLVDVERQLGRPLAPGERETAEQALEAAETALVAIYPTILDDAATDPNWAFVAVEFEATTAARLVLIPDAYQRATINAWPFTRDG
jgi:hypothetical protein